MNDSIFITGAGGYIAGTFLTVFVEAHPTTPVRALVRSDNQAERLRSFYVGKSVEPVVGPLEDTALLSTKVAQATIVVQGCGDHLHGIKALLEGVLEHQSAKKEFGNFYSDIEDSDEILALAPERTRVPIENTIHSFSDENNVKTVILAPCTILGHGAGALRTETHQPLWYNAIIDNGAPSLVGKGENAWSVVPVKDLGRAITFVVGEALKEGNGRLEFGRRGHYFIESFEASLRERAQAVAIRLVTQGNLTTSEVQMLDVKYANDRWGDFMGYLVGSGSRCRADKLKTLGWKPQDLDWKPLVEEVGGKRA
ncbi:Fc.00g034110.m01.CDS01 [Cosmosporella sp. VM-42]